MKHRLFYLAALALIRVSATAQVVDVPIYDDCSKNGYTKVIQSSSSLLKSGTAIVSSSAGRASCDYVQLWKNGPNWATFNVGATITDYANLTVGTDPTDGNEPYYNTANVGGLYAWNNPNLNGRMTIWTSRVSTGISDVATTLWGSDWKTPTKEQLDTLCNEDNKYGKTTWIWCDGSNMQYVLGCTLAGYKVSGVGEYAEYSIFLPAAGYFDYQDGVSSAGYLAYYWSSMVYDSYHAYLLDITSNDRHCYICYGRNIGRSVRAVLAQ